MVNVWDYKDNNKLKIICPDDEVYIGQIVTINDGETEEEPEEDSIVLQISPGKIISFYPEDIKEVIVLD